MAGLFGNDGITPTPDLRVGADGIATWHEQTATGIKQWRLKAKQYEAFQLLQDAGKKQIRTFLSGEGGMGKSLLIRLLVNQWRSNGFNVVVTASTGKAAVLIDGLTCHSAFKLSKSGWFQLALMEGKINDKHFQGLLTADIIIIDEVSMLTATALSGINSGLNYVASRGISTELDGIEFGGKSIVCVGDLYQLPAVQKYRVEEQIYKHPLWPTFTFLELEESCRVDAAEVEFAGLLSRARLGHAHLTARDMELLTSRLCTNHCNHCVPFHDIQRTKERNDEGKREELEQPQITHHCPLQPHDIIVAALVAKVDELNELALGSTTQGPGFHNHVYTIDSTDKFYGTRNDAATGVVNDEAHRKLVDKRLSNMKRVLHVYEGQTCILTVNKDRSTKFVNGQLGTITKIHSTNSAVTMIEFVPDDSDGSSVNVYKTASWPIQTGHAGHTKRHQFPLLPAAAVTVRGARAVAEGWGPGRAPYGPGSQ